jgi:uncharacterized protein (DUF697 family)
MAKQSWRAWPDPVVGQAGEYEQWRGGSPSPSFYEEFSAAGRYSDDLLRSLNGRNPDLLDAAEEVAAEQRVQIVLVSRTPHLPAALLAGLRQTAVTPASGRIDPQGIWLLATAPGAPDAAPGAESAPFAEAESDAAGDLLARLGGSDPDILLYLVAHSTGWCAEDTVWVAQLRTLGAPILPVVVTMADAGSPADADPQAAPAAELLAASIQRQAGVKPSWVRIGAADGDAMSRGDRQPPADSVALVQRVVALRPRVAVALAQDIAWCRPILARRIIRTGALFTALLSAQPVPLLDLPFQVVLQWKVALQLAAIYGRPGLDYRSREMVGTIVWNLLIRFVMQQAVRLAPVVGWLLSAVIGGVSTALLGHALITIYENEDRWDLAQQRQQAQARAAAAVTPVRAASAHVVGALRTQRAALSQRVGAAAAALRAHRPHKVNGELVAQTPPEPPAVVSATATADLPPTLPVVNLAPSTRRGA